jgi:hypothetical protein
MRRGRRGKKVGKLNEFNQLRGYQNKIKKMGKMQNQKKNPRIHDQTGDDNTLRTMNGWVEGKRQGVKSKWLEKGEGKDVREL